MFDTINFSPSAATTPASAIPAPTQKASWKPDVRACGTAVPAATSSSVRCSTGSRLARFPPEHLPGEPHVRLGRARAADREAERVAAVQLRVREEDLA